MEGAQTEGHGVLRSPAGFPVSECGGRRLSELMGGPESLVETLGEQLEASATEPCRDTFFRSSRASSAEGNIAFEA